MLRECHRHSNGPSHQIRHPAQTCQSAPKNEQIAGKTSRWLSGKLWLDKIEREASIASNNLSVSRSLLQ